MDFDIDSKVLCSYFSKIVAEEAKILISKTGWNIKAPDKAQFVFCDVTLNAKGFVRYPTVEKEIEVPIFDTKYLLEASKRFSGKVKVKIDKDFFVITSVKKLFKMQLAELSSMSEMGVPKLSYDGEFNVKVEFFKEAIQNSKLIDEGKDTKFYLSIEDKSFSIKTGGTVNEFTEKIGVDFADCKGIYKAGFVDVFGRLDGSVKIAMKTVKDGYPLKVSYTKVPEINAIYYLSPFSEGQVDEEKSEEKDSGEQ